MVRTSSDIIPTPGIHRGIPDQDYHAWAGASHTRLNELLDRSALHAWQEMNGGKKQTPAMRFGSGTHTRILQPDTFDPNEFEPRELTKIEAIEKRIRSHPSALRLLEGATDLELSFAWTDTATGVLCKGRADIVSESLSLAVDLKTTTNASKAAFSRSIGDYGYYRQGAFYLAGLRACGLNIQHFLFIAVEKEAPFAVAVYRLTNESILAGQVEIERALRRWRDCQKTGEWPGYSDAIEDIAITNWKLNAINDATAEAA